MRSYQLPLLFIVGLLVITQSALWPQALWSQEPARGRLSDGRAYRTDAQGLQLVDYIAELEINVEEMKRKVVALQDELNSKDQQLSKLQRTGSSDNSLQERDLLRQSGTVRSEAVAPVIPAQVEPVAVQPRIQPVAAADCKSEVASIKGELSALKVQLSQERESRRLTEQGLALQRAQYEQVRSQLLSSSQKLTADQRKAQAQLTKESEELQKSLKQLQSEKESRDQQLAVAMQQNRELSEQNRSLQSDWQNRNGDLTGAQKQLREERERSAQALAQLEVLRQEGSDLRMQLAKAEGESVTAKRSAAEAASDAAAAKAAAAAQTPAPILTVAANTTSGELQQIGSIPDPANKLVKAPAPVVLASRASLSPQRLMEINRMRTRIRSEMNILRDLIGKREIQYRGYQASAAQISFRLSPLTSSRNRSFELLAHELGSAQNMSELSGIQSEVREIRAKVNEDLALLKRMAKR